MFGVIMRSTLAEQIPNARLVEFDGDDGVWFAGDADAGVGRDRIFRHRCARRRADRTVSCRRCCSPISSGPRNALRRLGDAAWTSKPSPPHDRHHRSTYDRWRGDGREVHRRRCARDVRRSGARDRMCDAQSATRWKTSDFQSVSVCIPERSKGRKATSMASPFTSRPASCRWRHPAKCLCRA